MFESPLNKFSKSKLAKKLSFDELPRLSLQNMQTLDLESTEMPLIRLDQTVQINIMDEQSPCKARCGGERKTSQIWNEQDDSDDSTQAGTPVNTPGDISYEFADQVEGANSPCSPRSPLAVGFYDNSGIEDMEDDLFELYECMNEQMVDALTETEDSKLNKYPINPNFDLSQQVIKKDH